jgi:hypothetical protein
LISEEGWREGSKGWEGKGERGNFAPDDLMIQQLTRVKARSQGIGNEKKQAGLSPP